MTEWINTWLNCRKRDWSSKRLALYCSRTPRPTKVIHFNRVVFYKREKKKLTSILRRRWVFVCLFCFCFLCLNLFKKGVTSSSLEVLAALSLADDDFATHMYLIYFCCRRLLMFVLFDKGVCRRMALCLRSTLRTFVRFRAAIAFDCVS